ncbi:MAG: hypothetical protein K2W85_03995 [Phycisphaerales bacterium]|nr:hypothetical protein [Phycisphaerales bacterium]
MTWSRIMLAMSATLRMSAAHARHHATRTLLLVLCVCVAALLPVSTHILLGDFRARLLARAEATPLIAGAKGSRFDLVMGLLYFRRAQMDSITMGDFESIAFNGGADAFPIHAHFSARGVPIIATTPDYLDFRRLRAHQGRLPAMIGEVALGFGAAERLGLRPGDTVFSDQREMFDITKPPAIKLSVVGVLAPAGTPDDHVLFVDIKTAWALEGLAHGHADASKAIPDALLLERDTGRVTVSEEMVEDNQITRENATRFHMHSDPRSLPLTGVVVVPRSPKDLSILKARTNAGKAMQMVVPSEAVQEMLGYVARIEQLLHLLSVIVVGFACVLLGLMLAFSIRTRAREVLTLSRIGFSRPAIAAIFGWEICGVIAAGVGIAAVVGVVLWVFPPDLVKLL